MQRLHRLCRAPSSKTSDLDFEWSANPQFRDLGKEGSKTLEGSAEADDLFGRVLFENRLIGEHPPLSNVM